MELILNVCNYDQLQEVEVAKGDPIAQLWISKAINPTIMDSVDGRWTVNIFLHNLTKKHRQ